MSQRLILHADMDAFYASVEQRNRPELRGKPVIVGGRPEDRGVVATASYEARRFGVHSAMPTRMALRLCPRAVLLPPDFPTYRAVSGSVLAIYREWTNLMEPLSLDEAYLDLTEHIASFNEAVAAAETIRERVRQEIRLTVSVGVGSNKLVAKIASDQHKPDGLTVVEPDTERAFLSPLPVGRMWGIGPKASEVLRTLGVTTIGELAASSAVELQRRFGRPGQQWHEMAQGIDDRPVVAHRPLQQVSRETTFARDLSDPARADNVLVELAREVMHHLHAGELHGRTVTVKVRFEDFRIVSRQATLPTAVESLEALLGQARRALLQIAWEPGHSLRLLGIGVSNFRSPDELQLPLLRD